MLLASVLFFGLTILGPNSLIDSFSSVWFLLSHEGGRVLPLCHYFATIVKTRGKCMD